MQAKKVVVIVLDAVGCGGAPDAAAYGDEGANTLGHVLKAASPSLPNLTAMGLLHIPGVGYAKGLPKGGAFGRCLEKSAGKDTTTGHWEIAGLPVAKPFPVYPEGFPGEVIGAFEAAIGRKTLGNYASSGTEILTVLGEEHLRTGFPIVYTSADSVFQIAAHEDVIPPKPLWAMCETARGILIGKHAVGRVIARPFEGSPGAFMRTANRRDFSLVPPSDTMLDILSKNGYDVVGIGKIEDIFAHRGLTRSDHAAGNAACVHSLRSAMEQPVNGLIFVNLVDTDMLYGHRRDPMGFAKSLADFDTALPLIQSLMKRGDLLILTADHGCDPTFRGTDHTREAVPLLCWSPGLNPKDLGTRDTFADIAATVLEAFGLSNPPAGTSFLQDFEFAD